MGFRLVPKSVTLNNLERRNGLVAYVISPNSVALVQYYRFILRVKCSPKNLVFTGISLMAIGGSPEGDHAPARALKCSALLSLAKILHIISRNLETVQDRRSVTINY